MISAPPMIENANHGQAMKQLRTKYERLTQSLKMNGRVVPCTVVNFNPVRLSVLIGPVERRMPREGHFISPDEAPPKTFAMRFAGREYLPSYITLRDWIPDKRLLDTKQQRGEAASDWDPIAILPVEQAFQYYQTYNDSRSNDMGGVLVFGGEIEQLSQKSPEATIEVPTRTMLPGHVYDYHFETRPLHAELKRVLDKQKGYYESTYQTAMRLHSDPSRQFGTVHDGHRKWAQWGLDIGFRETAPPWMEATVQEGQKKCPGCKRPAIDEGAWFCVCGSPYDAYAAYMAGQNVGIVHLSTLPEEQVELVKTEMQRRARIEADFKTAAKVKQ